MSLPLSPSSDSSDIDLDMDPLSSDPTTGVVLHTDAPSDPTTDVDASATQANAIVSAKSFFTENGCSVRALILLQGARGWVWWRSCLGG